MFALLIHNRTPTTVKVHYTEHLVQDLTVSQVTNNVEYIYNMVKKYCIHMYNTLLVIWETVKPFMRSRILLSVCAP